MSADGTLFAGAEAELSRALLAALKADPDVQGAFGTPARLFDDESRSAPYPFAVLERHETEPSGASGVDGQIQRITLAVYSRRGGRSEAKALLGIVRAAAERAQPVLIGQRIVLLQTVYSDVLRSPDLRRFRGLIRLKIITEEI